MTMPIGFQCSNCNQFFCWACRGPIDAHNAMIKTIGSRYCGGAICMLAEAAVVGGAESLLGRRAVADAVPDHPCQCRPQWRAAPPTVDEVRAGQYVWWVFSTWMYCVNPAQIVEFEVEDYCGTPRLRYHRRTARTEQEFAESWFDRRRWGDHAMWLPVPTPTTPRRDTPPCCNPDPPAGPT